MKKKYDIRQGGFFALGVMSGISISLFAFIVLDALEIEISFDSAIFGSLTGALIAGAIGVLGQLYVISENREIVSDDRAAREKADLELLISRLHRFLNTLHHTINFMNSSDPKTKISFVGRRELSRHVTINDLPERISVDGLTLPLRMGDTELFAELNMLDSHMANFLWAYHKYGESIESLFERAQSEGSAVFEGGFLQSTKQVKPEDYFLLQDLEAHYRASAEESLIYCYVCISKIKGHLLTKHRLSLKITDAMSKEEWEAIFKKYDEEKLFRSVFAS